MLVKLETNMMNHLGQTLDMGTLFSGLDGVIDWMEDLNISVMQTQCLCICTVRMVETVGGSISQQVRVAHRSLHAKYYIGRTACSVYLVMFFGSTLLRIDFTVSQCSL